MTDINRFYNVTFDLCFNFADQAGEEESTYQTAGWVKQNLDQYVKGTPEITTVRITVQTTK